MLATSLPVAQWLERPTGVRKGMGSIPVGDSDFFFVPRSRHVKYIPSFLNLERVPQFQNIKRSRKFFYFVLVILRCLGKEQC